MLLKILFNNYDFFSLKNYYFLSYSAKPQRPRSVQKVIIEVSTILLCTEFNILLNAVQTATCIFKCLRIC